jgi:membrane-associated phospholipid phosphatase
VTPRPTVPRRARGAAAATPGGTAAELLVGAGLLGGAALAGLAFVHRPWPNRLDVWGDRLLPADAASRWAHDATVAGSRTALLIGVVVVLVVGVCTDRARALACAAAPVVAVLLVQDLAKPLVGRHLGLTGGSSYPSGTVAAVAALTCALALVVPRPGRPVVALAGAAVTGLTCLAVVVLRWHYPTDALGGVAVGVGAVLTLDALVHLPWALARRGRPDRRPATPGRRAAPVAA